MPMYQKLHSSIRKFDNDHILFFEPTIIITSVSQLFLFLGHWSSSQVALFPDPCPAFCTGFVQPKWHGPGKDATSQWNYVCMSTVAGRSYSKGTVIVTTVASWSHSQTIVIHERHMLVMWLLHTHTLFFQLPLKFSATGLTEGPGGPEYNDRYLASRLHYHILPLPPPLIDYCMQNQKTTTFQAMAVLYFQILITIKNLHTHILLRGGTQDGGMCTNVESSCACCHTFSLSFIHTAHALLLLTRQVLSYHLYCILMDKNGQVRTWDAAVHPHELQEFYMSYLYMSYFCSAYVTASRSAYKWASCCSRPFSPHQSSNTIVSQISVYMHNQLLCSCPSKTAKSHTDLLGFAQPVVPYDSWR